MNRTLSTAEGFIAEARKMTWKDVKITDREKLRIALIKKHGTLTEVASLLQISYQAVSDLIAGRRINLSVIAAIQSDLGLSDNQVLQLWPLLKAWPRKSRIVS